jgi:hypothetical protein
VHECCVARRKEKKVHKKKNWIYNEDTVQGLENLISINVSRMIYQEVNRSHKDEVGRR